MFCFFKIAKAVCFLFVVTMLLAQAQWGSRRVPTMPDVEEEVDLLRDQDVGEVDEYMVLMEFNQVVQEWGIISATLGSYAGLERYCDDRNYRNDVDALLGAIHHYDTLMYGIIRKMALCSAPMPSFKKALREIEKVEEEVSLEDFHKHLNDDCRHRSVIERDRKKIRNDLHINSYDGQVLIIENDIRQYVEKITHVIELINKHAFFLIN